MKCKSYLSSFEEESNPPPKRPPNLAPGRTHYQRYEYYNVRSSSRTECKNPIFNLSLYSTFSGEGVGEGSGVGSGILEYGSEGMI
jgi:hypothetical protein